MTNIVIVHGGFGGGWEWTDVARALRARGHEVFTPTLSGMGERHHLGPEITLAHQVEDLVGLLTMEDLSDVVLCGASYGAMSVGWAADRLPERIAAVVSIDGLVPQNGESGLDLLPAAFGAMVRAAADSRGHGWVPVPDAVLPPADLIAGERRARYVARLRPQPVATFTQPVVLTGAVDRLPRVYVRCTLGSVDVGGDPIQPVAARAKEQGWAYQELPAPHDPHLFDPDATADLVATIGSEPSAESL